MTVHKLASNTLWNLFGQILPLLLAVAVIPMLIKSMGVSRYGFLTLAWVLIGYAGLFDFGISRAMTRLVAKHVADGDKAAADQVARAGSSFMLLFGFVVGLLLFGFSEVLVDRWLKVQTELKGEAINSLRLLALSVPIVLLTAAYRGVLEAHQAFKPLAMIRVVMGALTYLGPLLALTLSKRLEVVVGTIVLMRVLANYLHARVCQQSTQYHYRWNVPDRVVTKKLFALGGWMSVSNIVSPVMTYMDRFILGGMVTIELVAYYATPYDMITRVMILPYAFMGALFPVLAGMGSDHERIQKTYSTTIRILFLLMLPITFTAIVLAHPIMELWLGGTFALHGAPVLQLLALGVMANTLAQAPANLIQSAGNPKWMALLHIIELPLFLFAIWFFTTRYGIVGTAFSWSLRMVIDSVILHLLVDHKLTKFNFSMAQLVSAVAVSIAFLVAAFIPYSLVQRLIVCSVGLTGFVFFAWFLVLTTEDKSLFTTLMTRRSAMTS